MSSRPRLLAALLLAAALAGCRVELYSGLTESEANQMLAALAGARIDAAKVQGGESGWQLQVDEHDLPAAVELLQERGLPGPRHASLGEVFQKQGLVATPAEERVRYIYGLSQELSRTVAEIDGVVSARVHVVIPANDPMSDKLKPSSAAVFIKHRPGMDLRLLAPAVKELVAHSVEGLSYEQVSLTLVPASETLGAARARVAPDVTGPLGLSGTALLTLAIVALLAAAAIVALPWLLRRSGLPLRVWLRRAGFVK
ncbi:type III secretion system inner membrane ring lipoprotein SctJ [Ideonella sp. YS5]|uniref:type III secretion system inner membrane ring lipoprotein SctJ n=1 Tax=Ideonella sp. YS5 TaxID=3453714 RepID=UPI003EEC2ABD